MFLLRCLNSEDLHVILHTKRYIHDTVVHAAKMLAPGLKCQTSGISATYGDLHTAYYGEHKT